jgi:hypothetical protein
MVMLAGSPPPLARGQETRSANHPVTATLQTGFTDTFQLTLGGFFGGTAWTNRVETSVGNTLRSGDGLYLFATDSMDVQNIRNNWQAGLGYRTVLWRGASQQLTGAIDLQHWKLSSVRQGTNDWLSHENLSYRNAATPVPFTVSADSWNLYSSPLPSGSILYTQLWLDHPIWRSEGVSVIFRHGPAHTVGLGFYGAEGNRVFRYQTALTVSSRDTKLEGGFRRQWAFQPGIPENGFWHLTLTQTLKFHR